MKKFELSFSAYAGCNMSEVQHAYLTKAIKGVQYVGLIVDEKLSMDVYLLSASGEMIIDRENLSQVELTEIKEYNQPNIKVTAVGVAHPETKLYDPTAPICFFDEREDATLLWLKLYPNAGRELYEPYIKTIKGLSFAYPDSVEEKIPYLS